MHKLAFFLAALMPLALPAADAETGAHQGPREILWRLKRGNQAFASGHLTAGRVTPARRNALVAGQHPRAVILTCADSRVPPEFLFNEGLGDLFVVRVAGVVADPVVVGSVEYAAEHLHTPLIVVMGHTRCGAVKAAIDAPKPSAPGGPDANIESILALLRPALALPPTQSDPWRSAVYGGVETSVADLMKLSRILPEMGHKGELGVVGAVYEVETGRVAFSAMLLLDHPTHPDKADVRLLEWTAPQPAAHSAAASHRHHPAR